MNCKHDLTERLDTYLNAIPNEFLVDSPNEMIALLIECRSALSPVLPEEVAEAIEYCNSYLDKKHPAIADLIERLSRDKDAALKNLIGISEDHTELQQRIEELEWQIKGLKGDHSHE